MAGDRVGLPASAVAKHDQAMTAASSDLRQLVALLRSSRSRHGSNTIANLAVGKALHLEMCTGQLVGLVVAAANVLADDETYEADPDEIDP